MRSRTCFLVVAIVVGSIAPASAHVVGRDDRFDRGTALDIRRVAMNHDDQYMSGVIQTDTSFSNFLLSRDGNNFYMDIDTGRRSFFVWIFFWRGQWQGRVRRWVSNDESTIVGRASVARINTNTVAFVFNRDLIRRDLSYSFRAASQWRGDNWDYSFWKTHRP